MHPRRDRGQNSPPAVKGWPTDDLRAKNRAKTAVEVWGRRKTGQKIEKALFRFRDDGRAGGADDQHRAAEGFVIDVHADDRVGAPASGFLRHLVQRDRPRRLQLALVGSRTSADAKGSVL